MTKRLRAWIFDQDSTPQRFPLQKLVRTVGELATLRARACVISRADGYGLRVNGLAQKLATLDTLSLTFQELDELSAGVDEWFYNLDAALPEADLAFGLHDSTALYVEGDESMVGSLTASFRDVRPALPTQTAAAKVEGHG
ncbi:MAG TPA: hypothetical protein VJN18_11535 [Polyangiaceae bacterium]|nr:hypothetical protein [Polyangiaceae bacterium]